VVLDLCRSRDVEQDLGRLVKGPPEQHKELVAASDAAAAALAALLTYTELLSDDTNYGKYIIQPYSLDLYMRLDAAALRALNVTESKTDANKNFSLFGLMNRTCTQGMGKRLLNRWLKQPLVDVAEITRRLDTVQDLNGPITEAVFFQQPPGFVAPGQKHLVCRLERHHQ
jgi:DNA mismatch repair protein MSH2